MRRKITEMVHLEGAFPEAEISKTHSFWRDVLVRSTGQQPLGTTDLGCHTQQKTAALYPHGTLSCFVARAFPGYCCVGINMLSDALRDLIDPKL